MMIFSWCICNYNEMKSFWYNNLENRYLYARNKHITWCHIYKYIVAEVNACRPTYAGRNNAVNVL